MLSGPLPVEFGEQPGLVDTGLTDHTDRLTLAIFDPPEKVVQNGKLVVASNEYRLVRRCPSSSAERRCDTPSSR